MRLLESANLRIEDLDLDQDVVIVVGKGVARGRAPSGSKTGQAVDSYLQMRSKHHAAAEPWLWVGKRGRMKGVSAAAHVRRRVAPCRRSGG